MNELIEMAMQHHYDRDWLAAASCWWRISRLLIQRGDFNSARLAERVAKTLDDRGTREAMRPAVASSKAA